MHLYVWYCVFGVVIICSHNYVEYMFVVRHCHSNSEVDILSYFSAMTVIINAGNLGLGSSVSVLCHTDMSIGSYNGDFYFNFTYVNVVRGIKVPF